MHALEARFVDAPRRVTAQRLTECDAAFEPGQRGTDAEVGAVPERKVAVDHARARLAEKRGGDAVRVDLTGIVEPTVEPPAVDVLALDDALGRLGELDAQQARVVELRFFTGLSAEETAEVLGVSRATVQRDWRSAKLWLFRELGG